MILYHNPRCSKSRQALALLEERGIQPTVVRYLDTPPDESALRQLIIKLGCTSPRDCMRIKEDIYKSLNLGDSNVSDDMLIQAISQHPILLERPILETEKAAIIGRPPENILQLL